jgi:EAL domain-containing protein (putative c-di-GMP-specific phosphodiesterase class I)
MLADRGACDTVDLIIALAHKMKLKVIADGIQTAKQLDRLRELECDLGQGSLLSKPVEAEAARQLLRLLGPGLHATVVGAE